MIIIGLKNLFCVVRVPPISLKGTSVSTIYRLDYKFVSRQIEVLGAGTVM